MSELIVSNDSQGIFISRVGQPPLYLQDKKGYLTQERLPRVQQFLGVKASEEGYELLCLLKNDKFAKFIIDTEGQKQDRQSLNVNSIADLASDFQLDVDFLSLIIANKPSYIKPERLIVHCGYHKVATTFFAKILRGITNEFGWKFQSGNQDNLRADTTIFLQNHSQINLVELPPFVGSHIIRDPRDMIISGYFYHLWTTEEWCHRQQPKYDNKSYQEMLNSVSQEEGIALEIKRMKGAILNMANWDYNNPNFIEVRLEDLAVDEKEVFKKIFEKYGFQQNQIEQALKLVEELSFEKRSGRKRGEENKNSHFRKGVSGDWKNYFTDEHKKLFKEKYANVLQKLGYEQDDQW